MLPFDDIDKKELGYAKITLKTIFDIENLKLYVKSSLLEEIVDSKWAALILASEELGNLELKTVSEMNVEDIIAEVFTNIDVTTDTYSEIATVTEFI